MRVQNSFRDKVRTAARRALGQATVLSVLPWGGGSAGHAQSQAGEVRYSAPQLNCARFLETTESDIQTETSGQIREQTAGRRGVWQFRATPAVDGVSLEGWLDSLYLSQARPFVPDEVAEVAGMGTALDDFFPPLPPRLLRPGQAWSDSAGVTLRRMADSGMSGVPLYRFELDVRREARSNPIPRDTDSLPLRQVSQEHGTFVWHPLLGLLRRDRRIVVETSVAAGRSIRQPVRSRVEQRITVRRDLTVPPEHNGRC
jgi:hypothetical protein